jgi:small conductance mechanosensitive channel
MDSSARPVLMDLFTKKADGRSLRESPIARQLRAQATSPIARQLRVQAVQRAQRARWQALVLLPMLVTVIWAYSHRRQLFGVDLPVRIASAVVLVILGWAFARALGGAMGPALFRRLDSGTAGTVGFLIRLIALTIAILFALRVAGLQPSTLAVGGAFTAVIVGLAAQQTIGNLIAGMVLLSARPFRVGDRVRFQAGALAGMVEGVVSSLGLLYTTLAQGEDRTMVPNSVVLSAAVVPLREPAAVDLRARLRAGVQPSHIQKLLQESVTVRTRARPHIGLEEVDADEVVVRIAATPESGLDGPKLADEILAAVTKMTTIANGQGAAPGGDGAGRPEGGERPNGAEGRSEAGKRPNGAEGRSEAGKRPNGAEGRPEGGERPNGAGRPEAGERPNGAGRPERGERPNGAGRPEAGERPNGAGRPARAGRANGVAQTHGVGQSEEEAIAEHGPSQGAP